MRIFLNFLAVTAMVLIASHSFGREVVIYTSVDQVFSEPILAEYEKITGIDVKVVYDVEASKTTGLVNRLIAEKKRPKCDVFWNSEFSRTIALQSRDILEQYSSPAAEGIPAKFRDRENYWTGFAARSRVLVYNTDLLKEENLPKSIFELTSPEWQKKTSLAYPLFGTTATHVAAMYSTIGKEKTEQYLQELKNNGVLIVDGNSVVRDIVAEGKVPLGFTDTDDVNVAITSGKPVKMIYPDADGLGTLFIPNTVALIKNGPNPDEGKKLIDYLLSKEVEAKLAFSESANVPLRDDVKRPAHIPDFSTIKAMDVDYQKIAGHMEQAARFCRDLFVR